MLKLSIAPYRLLFKQPFGTAHGFRDGTDSVFIRLVRNGIAGYGEATMPPYVQEDQRSVIDALKHVDLEGLTHGDLKTIDHLGPCVRAGISTAYFDLISKEKSVPIRKLLQLKEEGIPDRISLITLGLCPIAEIPSKLDELPRFNGLKIKLDGLDDERRIRTIIGYDDRPILIDANQAWNSVEQALVLMDMICPERLIGIEQPFPVDRPDLQMGLADHTAITVFADESVQARSDIDRAARMFTGVNLKLMKCGGLDVAIEMAHLARSHGMKVMLGSMSESSIGCAAIFQLSPVANVLDLDGPWLIANDPFKGLELEHGELIGTSGTPIAALDLNWDPIGA